MSRPCLAVPLFLALSAVVGVSPASAQPPGSADPRMTTEERQKLLTYLDSSAAEFVALLDGVTEAQWVWKPAPDRWSIAEIAAHLVISEDYLFDQASAALASPADPDWQAKTSAKTALLERVLPDRTRRVQAPEPLSPFGRGPMSKGEALAQFRTKRARTRQFIETTQLPLRQHLTKGLFPIFDPLNAYQFVLYIPLHAIRHCQQLAEVKADPAYPKPTP